MDDIKEVVKKATKEVIKDSLIDDIKTIRESQIRMEEDVKHHIKRTDVLEELHRDNQNRIEVLELDTRFKKNLKKLAVDLGKLMGVVLTAIALFRYFKV